MYSGYQIRFGSGGSWSFENNSARNVILLGIENISSTNVHNHKKKHLLIGEGPTFGINGSFGSAGKKVQYYF